MTDETCIAKIIWDKALASVAETKTAQGRAKFDALMRADVKLIEDASLRNHAVAILRELRSDLFHPSNNAMVDRILRIEAILGIKT